MPVPKKVATDKEEAKVPVETVEGQDTPTEDLEQEIEDQTTESQDLAESEESHEAFLDAVNNATVLTTTVEGIGSVVSNVNGPVVFTSEDGFLRFTDPRDGSGCTLEILSVLPAFARTHWEHQTLADDITVKVSSLQGFIDVLSDVERVVYGQEIG